VRREVAAHLEISPRSLAAIELEWLERLYELDLERFDPDRPLRDREPLSPSVCAGRWQHLSSPSRAG